MECPYCGGPMEAGYLSSRSPVFWSEEVSGLAFPTRKTDVLLGKMLGIMRPKSWICRACRKVITEY